MAVPHLSIGTSDDRINLLSGAYMLKGWEVGDTDLGMIFQESQLADYRQMAAYRDQTVIETFNLTLKEEKQDIAARDVQHMRKILRLVADYWTTTWQTDIVYLQARASCETNTRYAVVHSGRLVGESDPFNQPFLQKDGSALMDELVLIVERGAWLADEPGTTGTCVEISSQGAANDSFALNFDGTDDIIDCGSDASIDDLPTADFTVEAWIRPDSWGERNWGRIFRKLMWEFAISSEDDLGLYAMASYPTQAITYTSVANFALDGQWHHVAAVWDVSELRWDLAIDGEWPSTTVQVGVGVYPTDAAQTLYMGNDSTTSYTFDGDIGWSRISDTIRYTVGVGFTPDALCDPPANDGNTVALWLLGEAGGATIYDETANNNDGTITGAAWIWLGCEDEYMAATCDDLSVFVANKSNVAQINHCYYWDEDGGGGGGAWSGNLIGAATPFALLPAVPAADDFVIFGINTSLEESGPFCSLIFDIGTVIDPGTGVTIQWRYYDNGGGDTDDPSTWTALTVQDNTDTEGMMTGDPFDTEGIGSVHWEQPATWGGIDPDPTGANNVGITGYWVCAYVTASNDDGTPPTQDNRDIYTVTWPHIDLTADEVGGDLPALLRLAIDTRSAQDAAGSTTDLWSQRIMAGLRSCDRGESFSAYINISDEQLPAGTSQFCGGATAYADWVQSPTGRAACYTSAGADAIDVRVYVALSSDYYGRFHAFVRCYQDDAGTVQVRLEYPVAESSIYIDRKTVTRTIYTQDADCILDFGEIQIGAAANIAPYTVLSSYINIEAGASAGGIDTYFYDLILIPVDEWAFDAEDMLKNNSSSALVNGYRTSLNLDGIQNPRNILSHLLRTRYDRITRGWRAITNGLPILQTGKHQRLWFLAMRFDDYADADDPRANHEICHSLQVWKNQRYTTLRGDQ